MRKIILAILMLPVLFTMMCFGAKPVTVVRAEEPDSSLVVEFEEKTYTYTCNEGVISITFKSLNEVEITMTSADGTVQTVVGSYVRNGDQVTLTFMGNDMVIVIDEETMTFIEYVETAVNEFTNFRKTYVEPILVIVSGVSSLVLAVVGILSYLNRKANKQIEINSNNANDKVNEVSERTEKINDAVEKCNSSIVETNEIINAQNAKIEDLQNEVKNLLKLKNSIVTLCEVEQLKAQHDSTLVISGAAEKISSAVNELKKK